MDSQFWLRDLPLLVVLCSVVGNILVLVLFGILGVGRKAPLWEAKLMLWLTRKLIKRANQLIQHDKMESFKDEMALMTGKVRLR